MLLANNSNSTSRHGFQTSFQPPSLPNTSATNTNTNAAAVADTTAATHPFLDDTRHCVTILVLALCGRRGLVSDHPREVMVMLSIPIIVVLISSGRVVESSPIVLSFLSTDLCEMKCTDTYWLSLLFFSRRWVIERNE